MENCVRYYIADDKEKTLSLFYGSIDEEKMNEFLASLPKIKKERTFPILELSRIDGVVTCDLSKYYKSEIISRGYYEILDFKVAEEDLEDESFLQSEEDSKTVGYNIYLTWEESPEIINYLSKIDVFGTRLIMDFTEVYNILKEISRDSEETMLLFKRLMECFEFKKMDTISFKEVELILETEKYPSLKTQDVTSYFRLAFENGKKNYLFSNPDLKEQSSALEIISPKSDYALFIEKMRGEKNALGKYVGFLEGRLEEDKVRMSNQSFILNCLSDEKDLYTYQVSISFPRLYEFTNYINQNYRVIKEKIFSEIDWNCYENKPILEQELDKDIVDNNLYEIIDFSVKNENIHIRTQKAESVYIKWKESVELIRYIHRLIDKLTMKKEVDWANLSNYFDALTTNEQEKKQLYYAFFSCFSFGEPIEIIPNTIISMIEDSSAHSIFDLEQQKILLKHKKESALNNREFFAYLLESNIVSFPKKLLLD